MEDSKILYCAPITGGHKLCCHKDKLCCDDHFKKITNIINTRNILKHHVLLLEANQHIKKYAFTVCPYAKYKPSFIECIKEFI